MVAVITAVFDVFIDVSKVFKPAIFNSFSFGLYDPTDASKSINLL